MVAARFTTARAERTVSEPVVSCSCAGRDWHGAIRLMTLPNALARDLLDVVQAATEELQCLDAGYVRRPRAPGKWSPQQTLGHLIDSAANNHRRFVTLQSATDLVFDGYEGEEWVRVQAYDEADWRMLVELWRAYNRHLAHVVSRMAAGDLTRPRTPHVLDRLAWRLVPADEPATLEYLVRDYVGHLEHHLAQILPD